MLQKKIINCLKKILPLYEAFSNKLLKKNKLKEKKLIFRIKEYIIENDLNYQARENV
jgi:hypothetical protein